jgi:phosphate transport system permease protein
MSGLPPAALVNRVNLFMSLVHDGVRDGLSAVDPLGAVRAGPGALSPTLFTQTTPPPGSAGGLANAIYGSVVIVGGGDVHQHADRHPRRHLSRRIRQGRADRHATRFINDILLSAPSIVIGLFVYTIYVMQVGHFSGWAGRSRWR